MESYKTEGGKWEQHCFTGEAWEECNITIDVLVKICNVLECDFSDIVEMVPIEEKAGSSEKNAEDWKDRLLW